MAAANREPIDRRNDRLRDVTDDPMQRIHLEQAGFGRSVIAGFGALLLVTSGAEGLFAGPGQADSPDSRTPPSQFESPDQLVEGARPKRVVAVGPVDSDPRQAVVDLVGNVGELRHRSPLLIESHTIMVLPLYQSDGW